MPVLQKLKQHLFPAKQQEIEPSAAYDNWASSYDDQPDNLMLALDEKMTDFLLEQVSITGKIIVDIGCGTGRHWKKILYKKPAKLIGYDVSVGMLKKLNEKFPFAETYVLINNRLENLADESCDLIFTTLTIAHIDNIEAAFKEWSRVLKPDGNIIITDYHPAALAKGGKRTFKHNGQSIAIKNYIHEIDKIKKIAIENRFIIIDFAETIIDDSVKHYYEKQNALSVFEKFYGIPIIYGINLKKADAVK